jgi:hypothetical protein
LATGLVASIIIFEMSALLLFFDLPNKADSAFATSQGHDEIPTAGGVNPKAP